MSAKTRTPSLDPIQQNPIQQADLILRLYDLRRESVMRKARSYIGGDFLPASADELIQIVTAGNKHSSFVLQVYGYWDMVAAFVHNGALSPALVYDTCQEMYFQYAKIQPYLAEFRQKMNLPEWLINIERLIETSESGHERIATMRKNLAAIAEARSSRPSA
ncbi:MAG: hypothetical protein ABSA39_05065 [Edaphobacter sp.]